MVTLPASTRHSSTGTTVSASTGITAPVMMRTHSPASSRPPWAAPANTVPGNAFSVVCAAACSSAPRNA